MMLAVAACVLASCHTATQKEEREFVGNWLEVMPVNSQFTQGVTLNADGTAASIGMATLKYESWSLADGKLVLNGKSIGNGQTLDFSDTLDVVSLTADSLKLGKNGAYRIDYYRVKEVPVLGKDKHSGDGVFRASLTYLEAEDGKDQTYEFCGRQYTLRGNAVDKNATVLQFVPFDKAEDTMNFLFGGDKLTMLDRELRPIDSNLNYTLQLQ